VQRAVITLALIPGLAAYIAWLASFVVPLPRRSWTAICLSAALLTLILPFSAGAGVLGPYPWKMIVVFVEYLILVWTLKRFDFLTLNCAIATAMFCGFNYISLLMLRQTGSVEEKLGFAVWGLVVAAATAVAFKSKVLSVYRRVTESL
jgi:hypothetical protein